MKLWCCLCFTEEEQDNLNLMKEEDISENDVVTGVGAAAVADHHAEENRDDDRFAMTSVQPRTEALISWTGECSAAACSDSTVAGGVENRDLSHKRAKFYADFEERYFSTNAGKCGASNECGDYDYINDSLRPNGEACCDTFALMGGGEESGFDSSIVEDGEGDNIDILKVYMAPVLKQPRHMASGDNRGQKVPFGLVPICLGSRFETKCRK